MGVGGLDDVFDLVRNSAPCELSLESAARFPLATATVRRLPTMSPPEEDVSVSGVVDGSSLLVAIGPNRVRLITSIRGNRTNLMVPGYPGTVFPLLSYPAHPERVPGPVSTDCAKPRERKQRICRKAMILFQLTNFASRVNC